MADDRNKKPMVGADKRVLSGKKIARGLASELMKATGGSNVPILNGLVDMMFDYRKTLESITMEKNTKQKMKSCFDDMSKYDTAYATEEQKLHALQIALNQVISNLMQSKAVILAQYGIDGFTQQVELRLDPSILRRLNMSVDGGFNGVNFFRINQNKVARNTVTEYNKLLNKGKQIEREIYPQIMKVNKAKTEMNRNRKVLNEICNGLIR